MNSFGLERIDNINIPQSVLSHRFISKIRDELNSRTRSELISQPVFGTQNTQKPELYGWTGSVPSHVDNKGHCYFVVLDTPSNALLGAEYSETLSVSVGDIICMNDYTPHWVEQEGSSIAIFVGAYSERCDKRAVAMLKEAVLLLAKHVYYGAPRHLSAPLAKDECFCLTENKPENSESVIEDAGVYIKKISDAEKSNDFIERCSVNNCENPACVLDHHYPYMADKNLCLDHY